MALVARPDRQKTQNTLLATTAGIADVGEEPVHGPKNVGPGADGSIPGAVLDSVEESDRGHVDDVEGARSGVGQGDPAEKRAQHPRVGERGWEKLTGAAVRAVHAVEYITDAEVCRKPKVWSRKVGGWPRRFGLQAGSLHWRRSGWVRWLKRGAWAV